MRRVSIGLTAAFIGAALASACASKGAPHPPTTAIAAGPSTAATSGSSAGADAGTETSAGNPDPVLEERLVEYLRLQDWRSTVFVTGTPKDEPLVRLTRAISKRGKLPRPAQI